MPDPLVTILLTFTMYLAPALGIGAAVTWAVYRHFDDGEGNA